MFYESTVVSIPTSTAHQCIYSHMEPTNSPANSWQGKHVLVLGAKSWSFRIKSFTDTKFEVANMFIQTCKEGS
jgi:hypothetical protein